MTLESELGSLTERDLAEFVERHYPEKYSNFPAGVLGQYVRIARSIADQATLKQDVSSLTILCLMVVYGYGVCSDPLFPWLQKFLQKAPDMDNPDALLQRLAQKFLGEIATYVDSRAKRRN